MVFKFERKKYRKKCEKKKDLAVIMEKKTVII